MRFFFVILDNRHHWTDFRDLGAKKILGLPELRLGWCLNPKNPYKVTPTVSVAWPGIGQRSHVQFVLKF